MRRWRIIAGSAAVLFALIAAGGAQAHPTEVGPTYVSGVTDLYAAGDPYSSLALAPDGATLWAGSTSGFLAMQPFDPATMTGSSTTTVLSMTSVGINALAIDRSGAYAYALANQSPGVVLRRSMTTGAVDVLALPAGASQPMAIALSRDGRYAYVGTFSMPAVIVKIDLQTWQVAASTALAPGDDVVTTIAVSPDGADVYAGTHTDPAVLVRLDSATLTVRDRKALVAEADSASGLLVSPDSRHVYVSVGIPREPGAPARTGTSQVVRFDAPHLDHPLSTSASPIYNGGNFLTSGAMSADGSTAWYAAQIIGTPAQVTAIDLDTMTVKGATLTLGADEWSPGALVVDAASEYGYLALGTTPGRIAKLRLTDPRRLAVTLAGDGRGAVADARGALTCSSGTCRLDHVDGVSTALSATPAQGSRFAGWSGACTAPTGACTLTMSAARSVTATFRRVPGTVAVSKPTFRIRRGRIVMTTRVTVSGPGAIRQTASTRSGRRTRTRCTATRQVARAGTVTLTCRFDRAARRSARIRQLRATVATRFTLAGGLPASVKRRATVPRFP